MFMEVVRNIDKKTKKLGNKNRSKLVNNKYFFQSTVVLWVIVIFTK